MHVLSLTIYLRWGMEVNRLVFYLLGLENTSSKFFFLTRCRFLLLLLVVVTIYFTKHCITTTLLAVLSMLQYSMIQQLMFDC